MKLLIALILVSAQALALTPLQATVRARMIAGSIPGSEVLVVAPTGSMRPAIHERCLLVIERVQFGELRAGDVVVYRSELYPSVAHRLVRITGKGWLVKGDANGTFDAAKVTAGNLVGRVAAVVYF